MTTRRALSSRFTQHFATVVILVVGLAALFGRSVQADRVGRSYYVDSGVGKDTNAGTSIEQPWQSLTKVNATTFHPGDRILFKSGGVWTGQLWPKGSGSPEHPIQIDKYGGDVKPVINGTGLAGDAVLLKNQEYWEIQNLEITNTGAGDAVRRGVRLDSNNFGDMHHIYLRSLTIHDVNGTDKEKANGGINFTSEGDTKPSRFIDLRIEHNRIYRVDRSGIMGWSTHWVRSKWNPSLGVVIRGNKLDDIGGDGIVPVATDGALVEYNVVGRANQRSDGFNVAIWPWSADNTIIQFNEAYLTRGYHDGEGFDSDWNSRNTIIQYNYSHDNDGGFLLVCNDGHQQPKDSIGNIGTIVRYNISQSDRSRGINISGPTSHTLIYNNTIVTSKGRDVDVVVFSNWGGWADDTVFVNNVFYVSDQGKFDYALSQAPDGAYVTQPGFGGSTNNLFDHNAYFGNVTPPQDLHGLVADPGLVNPGSAESGMTSLAGYQLLPSSPLINSGKTMDESGGRDFWGHAVPSCGATDRGAAEFVKCAELKRNTEGK